MLAENNKQQTKDDGSSARRSAVLGWLLGLGIVALAAGVRLLNIGAQPFWLDEGYSWWDAQQTLARLWTLVPQCDPHPPLYFLALKGWMNEFGDSSQALRALSALFGVATTAVVILAGREIDSRVGWLAGLLFAFTPFQIDYGREARPYALLCFGAALMAFGALRIARNVHQNTSHVEQITASGKDGERPANRTLCGWLSLLTGGVIVLWTNNTAIFLVIAMLTAFGILLLVDRSSRSLVKPLIICSVLMIVLWLPYLPVVFAQTDGVINDFWIPSPDSWHLVEELSGLIGLNVHAAVLWAALVLLGGLLLIWRNRSRRECILLACLIVVPIALNYVFSMTVRPIFLSRAMIGITPAVVIVMAVAVLFLKWKWLRYAAIGAVLVAHGGALYLWHLADRGNEPWDRIARELAPVGATRTTANNDELVLLTANELALPLEHAFEELHVAVPVQGAPANFPSPGLHARYPSGKCAPSLLNQDLSSIARAIARYRVIYFITRANNVYDPGDRILKLLRATGYTETSEENFAPGSLEVYKFVSRQLPSLPKRATG